MPPAMTSPDRPLLRFGVIADPQYAPVPPHPTLNRFYARSLDKLRSALTFLDAEPLDFVVTLGDLVDHGFDNFDAVLDVYAGSRHEQIFLPGNHDFAVEDEHLSKVHQRLGMPTPYYDMVRAGVRIIVIDGNEVSLFAPPPGDPRRGQANARLAALTASGAPNAMAWNGGISESQFTWLEQRLALAEANGERAIVLGHYPLHPFTDHCLWDAPRVARLIADAPAAVAYLCGHDHRGGYGRLDTTHFVNFKGMVDTPDENSFAIVSLFPDRLEIQGYGREDSQHLSI